MPLRSPQKVVDMMGYLGGLNKDANVARLEPNETPQALNVVIGLRGEIEKRRGYNRHDANIGDQVTHVLSWSDGSGRDWLVAISENGNINYAQDAGTTFTGAGGGHNLGIGGSSSRHPIGTAVAQGSLYISSRRGHDTRKWNGTTWSTVPAVPKAHHLRWRYDQMYAANIAGYPSRLQVSYPLSPEDFTTQPAIFTLNETDGTEIRAMIPSGDDLLLFKDHAIWLFSGRVRSDFSLHRLDSLRGTFSPKTVEQVRGLIIFFDRDTGVWSWDGAEFTLISEKINKYLLDNVTYGSSYVAAAHVWRDSYVLSVPWQGGGQNQRSFCFSTLTNTWTEWDYGAWDATQHLADTYIASPKALFGLYRADTSNTDNGVPFLMDFRTPWLSPGGPGTQSRLRRLETNLQRTGAVVNVELAQEYDNTAVVSRTLTASNPNKGAEASVIKNLDGWGRRADAHQIRYWSNDDVFVKINHASAIFSVNEDVLGEHV